jgi:spore germination protein GerM
VITVDVQTVATCNPPDPLAPGPGQAIITVFYECGTDGTYPTAGIGVPRIVPQPDETIDRIEWTLRSLLAGPTTDEQAVGVTSFFDETTADALNTVTLTNGALIADFNEAIYVNNASTSTGGLFFNAELRRNVFSHPEVETVEFRINGDCEAWSAFFQSDGCWVISRTDWEQDLTNWNAARNQ